MAFLGEDIGTKRMITSGIIDASKIDFIVMWNGQFIPMSQLSERDRRWYLASVELEIKLARELEQESRKASLWERLGKVLLGD
jgi:hypothetical protein